MSRAWNDIIFEPFVYPVTGNDDFERFLEECFKYEEYCYKLGKLDTLYFKDFFNFTLYSAFE